MGLGPVTVGSFSVLEPAPPPSVPPTLRERLEKIRDEAQAALDELDEG